MTLSALSRGLLVTLTAAGFAIVPTPDASAQFGLKIGRGGVSGNIPGGAKRIREAKEMIRQGQKARPRKYMLPKAEVAAAIAKAEGLLAQADKKLKGLSIMNSYKDAKKRRDQLSISIGQDKLLAVCGGHWLDINGFHTQGKLAPDANLKALDQSVATFVKQAPAGFERSVKWWTKEAKRLRDENPIVAKKAKEQADKQAARAAQDKQRAIQQERAKAFAGITSVMNELDKQTKTFAGPITAAKLGELDVQIAHVKKVHAPAEYYFQQRKKQYALYNAMSSDITGASKILEGTAVASGDTGGKKKFKIGFKAAAGNCYLVLTGWKTWTNAERMKNTDFFVKGGTGGAGQRFWMRDFGQWMTAEGVCANKNLAVKYTGELTFAGTRNGLKYSIISWPKNKIPTFVSSRIGVSRYDKCDHQEWLTMWKSPIPGTVVWKGPEPYLTQSPKNLRGNSGNFWGIDYSSSSISTPELAKPAVHASKKTFRMPSCKSGEQRLKSTQSYMKCLRKMDKKYDAIWTSLKKQRKYPRSIGQYNRARKGLDNLGAKRSKEYNATCGKKLKKIEAVWQKTFNGLVDWVADSGPTDTVNTPVEWKKWEEARTRR